jgi:ubiquinone/menaquinone biosynthesis C-methylase UbiE
MKSNNIRKIQDHYRDQLPIARCWNNPAYVYSWRNPVGYYIRERIRQSLVNLFNLHRLNLNEGLMLDIGCGTGDWLRFFSELRGSSFGQFGLDLSLESLHLGKLINPNLNISLADARSIPFPNSTFQYISQFVTFEHLINQQDLKIACTELTRVCVPGGWLIWYDRLPMQSDFQQGFTLGDVKSLFPMFQVMGVKTLFRTITLPHQNISTAYSLARRSYWLADFIDLISLGQPTNLLALLKKNV